MRKGGDMSIHDLHYTHQTAFRMILTNAARTAITTVTKDELDLEQKYLLVEECIYNAHLALEELDQTEGVLIPTPRRGIPDRWRDAVFARDGWRCLNCADEDDLTVDHIVSLDSGGKHHPINMQTLCRSCNASKGTEAV